MSSRSLSSWESLFPRWIGMGSAGLNFSAAGVQTLVSCKVSEKIQSTSFSSSLMLHSLLTSSHSSFTWWHRPRQCWCPAGEKPIVPDPEISEKHWASLCTASAELILLSRASSVLGLWRAEVVVPVGAEDCACVTSTQLLCMCMLSSAEFLTCWHVPFCG